MGGLRIRIGAQAQAPSPVDIAITRGSLRLGGRSIGLEVTEPAAANTLEGDWAERSSGATPTSAGSNGITRAYRLRTQADIDEGLEAGDVDLQGTLDMDTGNGALRFNFPTGGAYATSDVAGRFSPSDNDGLGGNRIGGSEFWIQWKERMSTEMWTNLEANGGNWDGAGWKHMIVHRDQTTCAALELTVQCLDTDYLGAYTDCGGRAFRTNANDPNWHVADGSDERIAQDWDLDAADGTRETPNGYLCTYGNNCTAYDTIGILNKWCTYMLRARIGTLYAPDSVTGSTPKDSKIEGWIQLPDGTVKKFLAIKIALEYNGGGSSSQGYNNFTFTKYMTSNGGTAQRAAYTWVKEIITATEQIPWPGTDTPIVLPAWREGVALNGWKEIEGTAMGDVVPSPQPAGDPETRVTAWNGMAVDLDTSIAYGVANGGHTDYSGNEVVGCDFEQDAPGWALLTQPTPAADVVTGVAHYDDGLPTSRHTYNCNIHNKLMGRVMMVTAPSIWAGSGPSMPNLDGWDPATNEYDPANTYLSLPISSGSLSLQIAKAACVDPATGNMYVLGATAETFLYRYNRAANTWTQMADPPSGFHGDHFPVAWDSLRGRLCAFGEDGACLWTPNGSTGTWGSPVTISGLESESGAFYYAPTDRYYHRNNVSGGAIREIHPITLASTSLSTTGGAAIPATTNGVYSRIFPVPRLGGAIIVPEHDGNCWFLRLEGIM